MFCVKDVTAAAAAAAAAAARSQGNTTVFDLILQQCEQSWLQQAWRLQQSGEQNPDLRQAVRKALLSKKDRYGNTALHLAAWNGKTAMLDRLVELGANMHAMNKDGLTAFTLATRYGVWTSFNHIWKHRLTKTLWRFGNVIKEAVDYSSFDYKGLVGFGSRAQAYAIRDALLEIYHELSPSADHDSLKNTLFRSPSPATPDIADADKAVWWDLHHKHKSVMDLLARFVVWKKRLQYTRAGQVKIQQKENDGDVDYFIDRDATSAVRLITLFRPSGWYKEAGNLLEEVVLLKWAAGFHLVHLGQNVLPFCIVLALFSIMWIYREINVLQHDFWWAEPQAVAHIAIVAPGAPVLQNPIVGSVGQLQQLIAGQVVGRPTSVTGLLPPDLGGPESMCGWEAISGSTSGALQVVLILYGVPSLLRLAYAQRRIRPTDLDEDQNSRISFDELVNFIYFNLESLLHIVLSFLLVVIGASRVAAGPECDTEHLRGEKNAMAVAAIFFFFNLFIVCKPYKGIGLMVLTIYRFLVNDVFNFLVMYSIFFTAFLLALQSLHNANHVFLAWMDSTTVVVSQIEALTGNTAFLQNANIPSSDNQLMNTYMAIEGCQMYRRTIYDTAFTLLEVSFGDGFSDGLLESRRQDYTCPGFSPDNIVGYIIVFWVFLTNVLVRTDILKYD